MRRKRLKKLVILLLALCAVQPARAQLFIFREFPVNEEIPDGGELLKVHNSLLGGATIADLKIGLNIAGRDPGSGFNGDLHVTLGHEEGYSVLLNRPGKNSPSGSGYSDSGLNVTFDDAAANGDIHVYRDIAGPGAPQGSWTPDARTEDPDSVVNSHSRTAFLSSFNGTSTDGEWRLFLADVSLGAAHTLESWSLEMITGGDFSGPIHLESHVVRAQGDDRTVASPLQITTGAIFEGGHSLEFAGPTILNGNVIANVQNTTRLGSVSEAGISSLTKTGGGTLVLAGQGTYSGSTVVEAGTLLVENSAGSATGSGSVTVRSGATFGGTGIISGTVSFESGSTVSPGLSPGTLELGSTILEGGAAYRFEMNQADSGQGLSVGWDWLNITGTLTIAATEENPFIIQFHTLTLGNNPGPAHDLSPDGRYTWTILSASGGVINFDAAAISIETDNFLNEYPNASFGVRLNGNDIQLTLVPEPIHYGLFTALALLGFAHFRKRK